MRNVVIGSALALVTAALVIVTFVQPWADPSPDPEGGAAVTSRPVVLFIGDSYAAGTGVESSEAWVRIAADELGWSVVNEAIAGTGFSTEPRGKDAAEACGRSQCLSFRRAAEKASWRTIDLVVVSGGRQDALVPVAEQSLAIDALFDVLRSEYPDTPIVVTNPLWDDTILPASLEAMTARLSETDEITYLGLGQPLQFKPELIGADQINPNPAGHRAIARAFVDAYRAAA